MLAHLDVITFAVNDLEKSLAFCRAGLGLPTKVSSARSARVSRKARECLSPITLQARYRRSAPAVFLATSTNA